MKVKCVGNTVGKDGWFNKKEIFRLTIGRVYEIGFSDGMSGGGFGSVNIPQSSWSMAVLFDDGGEWRRVPLELFVPVKQTQGE